MILIGNFSFLEKARKFSKLMVGVFSDGVLKNNRNFYLPSWVDKLLQLFGSHKRLKSSIIFWVRKKFIQTSNLNLKCFVKKKIEK
jgi:hypothetical protein